MKHYYLLLISAMLALSVNGQGLMPKATTVGKAVPNPALKLDALTRDLSQDKAITCLDTSFYPLFKSTGAAAYLHNYIGNWDGASQAYYYNGTAEIIGIYYYSIHDFNGTPGDLPAIPANFKVYNIDGTNAPTTAIRSEAGSILDVGFDYQAHIFATPVAVSGDFALAIEMGATATTADSFYIVSNTHLDGLAEDLSYTYASGFGGYYNNLSVVGLDADFYIMPIIRHNLNAGFSIGDVCLNVGETLDITNTSSWVSDANLMFNVNTLVGGSSYGWDFGDGNGSSAENPLHSYSSAGGYTVTLTDTLYTWTGGCLESATLRVSVGLNGSVSSTTDPLCNGGANGTITLSGAGGISPYTYSSNGSTFGSTNPLTGFTSGSKTVYLQDSLGCKDTITTSLSQPAAISINSQSSTPAACGGSDGTVTFLATGGTGVITYSIDGSTYQASGSFTGLTATTYTLYAKDANSCVETSTETVSNSGAPTFSSANSTSVSCNGGADGTITLSGTGGIGALEYSIDGSNFFSSGSFTGLAATTYTATVRDSAGCSSSQNVVVGQPAVITADAGANQTVCENVNGAVVNLSGTITVASGYSWTSTGGTFSSSTTQNTTFTPSATQIAAGTATVTLTTTGNGTCSAATDDVVITITPAPTANAGTDQTVCANNSSINLSGSVQNASGGTWTSTGTGFAFGNANSLTSSYSATNAGTNTLILTTTGNGICNAAVDTMLVTITPAPTADAGSVSIACVGDTANLAGTITVASGAVWSTSGTGSFSDSSALNTTYVFTTADGANGSVTFNLTTTGNGSCLEATDGVFWFVDPAPVFTLGADTTLCDTLGALSLTVGLGADYSYLWSNGVVQETNNVTTSGTYSVTVTDTNSCDATDAITVTFTACGDSNTIGISENTLSWVRLYPNPTSGVVTLKMNVDQVTTLEVLNIVGEVITTRTFNATNEAATIDISNQKNGVYFFRLTKGNEVVTKQINLVR